MNNNRRAHVAVATTQRGDEALTAGGPWWYGPAQARADGAQWKAAGFYALYIGFRCAYDAKG
ncbi:MAG: hypothetical protein EPO10_14585 [Reyranella sp.]|nr:MAG: hypothetical protein EPO41_08835 [Reyranella sp.]TBR28135.1 MAG: hypothetical protein EPO10_14585 [Reyranella sp.]